SFHHNMRAWVDGTVVWVSGVRASCFVYVTCIYMLIPLFYLKQQATAETYTLSLHDALPIWRGGHRMSVAGSRCVQDNIARTASQDRKSTRLNSSHVKISYAVFCLKKKKKAKVAPKKERLV